MKSELTVDIDASISKAHDASLPRAEQQAVQQHLAYILTKIREPHTQIEPIKEALKVLEARRSPWYMRPVGVVFLAVVGGVITAGIAKQLGWI